MNAETINSLETGIRKAAIFVASLDPAAADAMLVQLAAEQARRVRAAAAALSEIDADEQQRVIEDFLRIGPMVPEQYPPGIELDAPTADQNTRADDGPPFGFLGDAKDEKLTQLLYDERPQTIALVLSHLPPQRAGGVLAHFPPHVQVEVVRRLVDLDETDSAVLQEVERALEARLAQQFAVQQRRVAGLEAVSAILDACDNQTSGLLLENLAAYDRRLAERLGLKTLNFDDLALLDDAEIATVLRAAEPNLTQTALIGASSLLVKRFLQAMSSREARRLRKQLDYPGPLRLSDIEDARRQLSAIAQRVVKNAEKSASAA